VVVTEILENARAAIRLATRVERRLDEHFELLVLLAPRRRWTLAPRVEARGRQPKGAAQLGDRPLSACLLRGDERELHVVSFAKKAAAFFRMSRSTRSCRF